jgi:hypothetical protein
VLFRSYISTYYINPRVTVSEKVTVNYYVTDFHQKEYLQDDCSETFTIDYWVNGKKTTLSKVPAGDNSISLDPLPKGKVLFALQATDRLGAKSHRLFFEFLALDPADRVIPEDKVLHPDLAQFGISSDGTHPVEITAGLTGLLRWASEKGYRKVVLPAGGKYRIDENSTVQMATDLTLDMNGSTFKQNPNAGNKALMLEFIDCYDSHVVNGTFEGDLKEHDFSKSKESEWVNCMSISQGSQYCSVEDVTIKDVTGYGTCTNHRHSYGRSQSLKGFRLGDLDERGQEVPSTARTTNDGLVSIKEFVNTYGFIQVGIYLGYQGNPAKNWVYRAHFFDAEKTFIETIEGYLYRRLYPPKNAAFARVTLLSTATPEDLCVYNFRAPVNCAYINIRHENIRCVAMALCGFENFLVEGCTFENCGSRLAKCAFDAEDGWDMMHDLTFRNNVFGTNPVNEFLTCAGHNFVMENNTMAAYVWERTKGYVFRNNKLKRAEFRFGKGVVRTGYVRIQNNTFEGEARLVRAEKDPERQYCAKANVCQKGINTTGGSVFFYKCRISGGQVAGKAVNCEIANTANQGGAFEIQASRLTGCVLKTSGAGVISKVTDSALSDCKCIAQGCTLLMENNTINETEFSSIGDWSDAHEFILRRNTISTGKECLVTVGNSYKQVVLHGNTIHSTHKDFSVVRLLNPIKSKTQLVEFQDNKFNGNGGLVLKLDRLPAAECVLAVNLFGNTCTGIGKCSANASGAPNIKITEK